MKQILQLLCAVLLGAGFVHSAAAATTDGTASFTVTFTDPPGNYNRRVDAFWVTDASGRFIKTVRKDAATRQAFLTQWAAVATSTTVDGYSGATISTWTPVTVSWNCRDANNVIVPDGTYKFYVEFTDHNGQGWWTTTGIAFTKGTTPFSSTYPDQQYLTGMSVTYTPAAVVHDVAVTGMTPGTAFADTNVTVQVSVTNKTASAESFSVTLSNVTTGTLVGTQTVGSLAGNSAANLAFTWNTAGLQGNYVLRATAGPVTGETSTADNTFNNTIAVQRVVHDIAVTGMSPNTAQANSSVAVQVALTNRSVNAESFSVTLSNVTAGTLIGTQTVGALAGNRATNVAFAWSTANLQGNYVLRATAGPVAGETSTADNSFNNTVAVQLVAHDIAVAGLAPSVAAPNTNVTVTVNVVNKTANSESFSVVLSNLTTASVIGTRTIGPLAGNAATNVTFPWSTANLAGNYVLRADAGPITGEVALADNTLTNLVSVRAATHDVGIASLLAPAQVAPESATTITVVATNAGDTAESFGVQLFDTTDARPIGATFQVASLAAAATVNVPFTWNTTNSSLGTHTLRAVALPVAGESAQANNTNTIRVEVASAPVTNTLIAKGGSWRYHDQGVDLSQTPWRTPDYYDLVWQQGAAPLGYSANGRLTNLATRLSWGPVATNKYPAYYFRREFYVDALPSALTLNIRRVDSAVVYLNGTEIARQNLAWSLGYADLADAPVTGADAYTYFPTSLAPTNIVLGRNVLAVEVHRADLTNSDLAFDLEMIGTAPQTTATHRVDTVGLSTPGSVIAGDNLPVTVTVTNRGNATETVLVILKNSATGKVLGTQTLSGLVPGSAATAQFNWSTLGAATGTSRLVAYTVVGGVTNLAGAFTNNALISGSGFVTNTIVNATNSLGGRCTALATNAGRLLVGAGATLEVWNLASGSTPAKQGAVRLPGLIQGIAASGSYAFVACGPAGLQFVDLSTPSRPIHRRSFNTSGHAYGVAIGGSYLYLADGSAGLRIFNIASPASPSLAGAYYTVGPARAVAVSGSRAYLLDQEQGLLILNVSNPAAPSLLGTYADFTAGQALAVSGTYAYLVDGNNHFAIVNLANPAAPSLTGSLLLPNVVGQDVLVNGTTVYVAAGTTGLLTINAASPAAPVLVSTTPVPGEATELALASSRLYVADGFAGFQVFNVSSPAAPALQADLPMALRAVDVVITNNLAYVAAGESGLRIFSLTNAGAPVLLSRFTGLTNARAIAVSGSRAYVGDGQYGLKVINVANPSAPTRLSTYSSTNLGSIRDVGVYGSLVLVSDGRTLQLLDASQTRPGLIGTYKTPAFAFALAVNNNRAYLACGKAGLVILNLSRSSFGVLSRLALASPITDVAVAGNWAYVAAPLSGWQRVDVSSPSAPRLVQSATTQGPILALAASGTNLTLVTATNFAVTMDVSVPLTPVPRQSFGPLVRAIRLAANPALVLAAEDEAGLGVFAVSSRTSSSVSPSTADASPSVAASGSVADDSALATNTSVAAGNGLLPASLLPGSTVVLALQPSPDRSAVTLQWHSVAGQTYTIYRSTDLSQGFSVFQPNIPATPPLNTATDSLTNGAAFYIISVQ